MTDLAAHDNLATVYEDTVALRPDTTALIEAKTGRHISYGSLAAHVARAGNALSDLGVERGERVGLLFTNCPECVYAFFGAIRIGAVPVPVNIRESLDTIEYIIEDSGASTLITGEDSDVLDTVEAISRRQSTIETVVTFAPTGTLDVDDATLISFDREMNRASSELPPADVSPDDPALQPYTSGSTGNPKGVVLSHGGAAWNAETVRDASWLHGERAVVVAPLYHKNAMAGAVKPVLSGGGSIIILDGFDPEAYIAAIDDYEATYLTGVPAIYRMVFDEEAALAASDLSSVQVAACASASVSESLLERFRDVFPDADIIEGYGLTEGGPVVSRTPRWGPQRIGSSGLALPGTETEVIDPETGERCPPGEAGELLVHNPGIGSYYERPEVEAEAFEMRDGKRFLHTEDLVRKDEDGYHYIIGRLDDMLIVGGENVYPASVENLLADHDAVHDVAVVGVPHETKGEAPVAFVVGDGITEQALKEYALERGPTYAHPRRVFFLDELPLTGTGKLDRAALESEATERLDGSLG